MSVTGTRRVFTPKSLNCFSEIVLRARRVDLNDLDSPAYCLLENNNVGKMAPQSKGHLAMIFFEGEWRLCFVWRLVKDAFEFFVWVGPCTSNESVPSVLFLDEYTLQKFWGEHLQYQKIHDATGMNLAHLVWINYIAPPHLPHSKPLFISPPFESINPYDKCIQMSIAGPCAIWLPQPHRYRLILSQNLEREKRKRTTSRGYTRDPWRTPEKQSREYCVLYVLRRPEVIQKVPPDEVGTVLVPFIEESSFCSSSSRSPQIKSFGVVWKREVSKLPQAGAGDFNQILAEVMQRKVTLLAFPEPKSASPLRIVSVDDVQFKELQEDVSMDLEYHKHKGTKYLYGTSILSAVHLRGTMLACWDVYEGQSKQSIPFDFICRMYQTVGDGYADRACALRVGTNVYFGARHSSRPRPSPNSGKGPTIYDSRYYRESYQVAQVQAIIEATVDGLGGNIVMMAKAMNPHIFNFLGPEVCSKNIWTQGYPSSQQGKRRKKGCAVLAFANDPHVDKCDLLADDIQMEWMTEVTEMLSISEGTVGQFAHRVCKKLLELKNTFGLGLPTTCGYAYCHESKEEAGSESIQQYFVYDGLGISVPIVDGSVHHFYGWAFVHRTSLCLRVFKDIVYSRNTQEEKDFILAAWGRSGGSSEAKSNAGTRRRRR